VAERIRFHLDENVDPDVARALRQYGIDVTTTIEAGLRARSDTAQWAFVAEAHRVIVTHDTDFLRLGSHRRDHPGIVYCDKLNHSIGDIIRNLILIYEVLTPEEIAGRVEYL
jgi:predicted nuclease of predicted toxin-antitoxin system